MSRHHLFVQQTAEKETAQLVEQLRGLHELESNMPREEERLLRRCAEEPLLKDNPELQKRAVEIVLDEIRSTKAKIVAARAQIVGALSGGHACRTPATS